MRHKLVRSLLALAAVLPLAIPAMAVGQVAARETTDARVITVTLDPLRRPVTVVATDLPLGAVLNSIATQARLGLVYNSDSIPVDQVVTLQIQDTPAGEALQRVLAGTDVEFALSRNTQVVLSRRPAAKSSRTTRPVQKTGVIMGRVVEAGTVSPIAGAQILVDSVGRAITNSQGMYRITGVAPGKHTVSVISIGHRGASREVEVGEGATITVSFVLEAAPTQLSELVVTAAGEKRRRIELGNDIVVINADSVMKRQPISSVADLLEGRVPGLVVQRSSGTPGDPTRIRIRGVSSPNLSNDPIIIVDGLRVYSEQSGRRGANLANSSYSAPSPLDYLPPGLIETIQVVKGPSAATMYGQDAANGVIVITTKTGRPGKALWSMSVDRGQSQIPTDFPQRYVRLGRAMTDDRRVVCPANGWLGGNPASGEICLPDSEVQSFQALRDPFLTILDRGDYTNFNIGVGGGVSSLTYTVNANYRDESGIVRLSDYEIQRFRAQHGRDPEDWMRRPQYFKQWGVQSKVQTQLGSFMTVSLNSHLTYTEQRRSELERSYMELNDVYIDRDEGVYYKVGDVVLGGVTAILRPVDVNASFYERVMSKATQFTNGLEVHWRPRTWLTIKADAGLSVAQRADDSLVPSGIDMSSSTRADGDLRRGQGTTVTSTIGLRTTSQIPLGLGFSLMLGSGINYMGESIADMRLRAAALPEGVNSIIDNNNPVYRLSGGEERVNVSTFGWYIEPGIAHRRMWLNLGLRFDGGSSFGSNVKLPVFPKLSYSYAISDEPFFPDALRSIFSDLGLRVAYGHAGRQPGPTERLRLYSSARLEHLGGVPVEAIGLQTLGNTDLKPERTQEFEGGFDAGLFDDRVRAIFTVYQKTTKDALLDVPVAPSVYGSIKQPQNIGTTRNTGFELALSWEPLRRDLVTWNLSFNMSQNRNKVLELGEGVEPFWTERDDVRYGGTPYGIHGIRVVPGFPLHGRWSTPVLGYDDANGNGILEEHEVVFGDTAVYTGHTLPNYSAGLSSTWSLFRGALSVSAELTYIDGLTQWNRGHNPALSRGWNDPSATSLFEQLQYYDRAQFTRIETVYALRLNNMSVQWQVPREWAGRVGASSLILSLQGTNLGLRTNYTGLDPNVNSSTSSTHLIDNGALPMPRKFQFRLSATY